MGILYDVVNVVYFRTQGECLVKYLPQASDISSVFNVCSDIPLNVVYISPAEFRRRDETSTQLHGSGNARSCYVRKPDLVCQSPLGLTSLLNAIPLILFHLHDILFQGSGERQTTLAKSQC